MKYKYPPIKDYFGNLIEVGDRIYYNRQAGIVVKLRQKSLLFDIGAGSWNYANQTMNCNSPDQAVCLDRVPEDIFNYNNK